MKARLLCLLTLTTLSLPLRSVAREGTNFLPRALDLTAQLPQEGAISSTIGLIAIRYIERSEPQKALDLIETLETSAQKSDAIAQIIAHRVPVDSPLIDRAFEWAKQLSTPEIRAQTSLELSSACPEESGLKKRGLILASENAAQVEAPFSRAKIQLRIANAYARAAQTNECLASQTAALNALGLLDNAFEKSAIQIGLAKNYATIGLHAKCAKIVQEIGSNQLDSAHKVITLALAESDQLDAAEAASIKITDPASRAFAHQIIIQKYADRQDWERVRILTNALDIPQTKAGTLAGLAIRKSLSNQPEQAQEFLRQADLEYAKITDINPKDFINWSLTEAYSTAQNQEKALQTANRITSKPTRESALELVAKSYVRANNFSKVLALAEETTDPVTKTSILLHIAAAQTKQGIDAQACRTQALALINQIEYTEPQIWLLLQADKMLQ